MGTLLNRRRYMGGGGGLPYDAEVEYLESTGTAYIDTGITPTLSYSVEMEFYLVSPLSSESASATMFGTLNGWNKHTFMVACSPSISRIYNCWGNRNTTYTDQTFVNNLVDNWHTLLFRDKRTYIDDTPIGSAVASPSGNPVGSIHLFCAKNYGDNTLYGVGSTKRIRRYKIYDENSKLVIDYIPVRVGTTGYMYDKVTGRLFGNQGTDAFIIGSDKT